MVCVGWRMVRKVGRTEDEVEEAEPGLCQEDVETGVVAKVR